MMKSDATATELRLVKARLAHAVSDWMLETEELAALLGLPWTGMDPLNIELDEDGETRMRLVIEVANGLDRVFSPEVLSKWLRDGDDGGVTPLAFISGGVTELRAMRAAAARRAA